MELCEVCRINTATIHLTQIEQGEAVTRHLCEECANEEGIPIIAEGTLPEQEEALEDNEPITCAHCGTTEDQLTSSGEVGCTHCYETFQPIISERSSYRISYRRYDGKRYRQTGSRSFQNELDTLRRELATAIAEERFEVASVLRDRIRDLEGQEDVWS